MSPKVLAFNIADEKKINQLNILSVRLNFSLSMVPRQQQGCLLRNLLAGTPGSPAPGKPFSDEMLVLAEFDHADLNFLLNELIRTGQQVRLKAVATPTNLQWTAVQLHRQLLAEAGAMQPGR